MIPVHSIFRRPIGQLRDLGTPRIWSIEIAGMLLIAACMWLTKQAKRLVAFHGWLNEVDLDWPSNLWPGVSVTSNATTWRIDELLKVESAHRFISYEPAWEYVDFSRWTSRAGTKDGDGIRDIVPSEKIALIIMGGQSGSNAKPFVLQWATDTMEICQTDEVCCFLKQLGRRPDWRTDDVVDAKGWELADAKGGDWSEWPLTLMVRDFPEL